MSHLPVTVTSRKEIISVRSVRMKRRENEDETIGHRIYRPGQGGTAGERLGDSGAETGRGSSGNGMHVDQSGNGAGVSAGTCRRGFPEGSRVQCSRPGAGRGQRIGVSSGGAGGGVSQQPCLASGETGLRSGPGGGGNALFACGAVLHRRSDGTAGGSEGDAGIRRIHGGDGTGTSRTVCGPLCQSQRTFPADRH